MHHASTSFLLILQMNSTLDWIDRSLDLNKFRRHIVTAYTISRPPKNRVSHLPAHKQSSAETTREIDNECPNGPFPFLTKF